MITNEITKKALLQMFLLYSYIGGFSFYWGSMQIDLFAIVIIAFLLSHFLGNYITLGLILDNDYIYRFNNRYQRLLIGFVFNVLVVYLLIEGNQHLYETGTFEYIYNPMTFGMLYGMIYLIPYTLTLKSVEIKGGI